MARLTRKNIKVFAGDATNNGVFGSLQANSPTLSNDVEQIQSLTAWSEGWDYATETSEALPPLEEFQGVQYVTTYQQAYIMQEGIPEWASTVTYYKGCLAKEVTANGFRIYNSLTDNNNNHLLSDTSNWKKVMDSDDLYAYDSAVVHLAGAETITGAKTFAQGITQASTSPRLNLKDTDIERGSAPSAKNVTAIDFQDTNGNYLGYVQSVYNIDKTVYTQIGAKKSFSSSDTDVANIVVGYGSNGTAFAHCPTPTDTTSTSSIQIATVGWANSANNNIVHKSGNETIGGTKTFTSNPYIKNAETRLYMNNTQQTKGTAPSSNVWSSVNFNDANGNLMGRYRQLYEADKSNRVELQVQKANSSSDTDSATMGIKYPASGNPYGFAPASSVAGSILTTVAITKATDKGVLQLGNGMYLQWGTIGTSSGSSGTVNFRKEFSNKSYSLLVQYEYDGSISSSYGHCNGYRSSTQSFEYHRERNVNLCWWAIGY